MAVNQQLLQPEQGWKRYDDKDSNIEYVGNWKPYDNSGLWEGSSKYTNDTNASIRFDFTGSRIRIISEVSSIDKRDDNIIIIDGNEYKFSESYSPTRFRVIVFEKTDLSKGIHFVEIKPSPSVAETTGYGINMVLDAIDIDENGELKQYYIPKHLIEQSDNFYSIKPEYYEGGSFKPITLSSGDYPIKADFDKSGFDNLNDLLRERKEGSLTSKSTSLDSGKMFSFDFGSDFKSIKNTPNVVLPDVCYTDSGYDGMKETNFSHPQIYGTGGGRVSTYPNVETKVKLNNKYSLSKMYITVNSTGLVINYNCSVFASNDDVDYITLLNNVNVSKDGQYININNNIGYKYYKVVVSSSMYDARNGSVSLIRLFGCLSYVTKYLIQDRDNILYTYDGENIIESPSQTLNEQNYLANGFEDTTLISEDKWSSKFPNKLDLKLLMYTDDIEKTEATMTYELKNPYKPIDILKKNNSGVCNILMSKN
ncbi:hypothetical protein KQI86_03845 [Clostridium sp. MSJ-11]|uniref:Uncharacterized protein n=1 Tax=Clostridium mobile TaxID=2841512 RepID=A0ABS6EEI5_9CLOT|nr:hypothetical protein [Clostridium mobile]MBU5483448.1 hypothetical protein [Clostridium mobile]